MIYIDDKASYNQSRNLLYTAISRCKDKIVLVGLKKAIKNIVLKENTSCFCSMKELYYNNSNCIRRESPNFKQNLNNLKLGGKVINLANQKFIAFNNQYIIYNGLDFKTILKKYKDENLARVLINYIIQLGRKNKIKIDNLNLFYKYIEKNLK